MKTKLWKVNPTNPEQQAIREASELLKQGGLVAFPTETVYGLGAIVYNKHSVKKIFEVKGRPRNNPLIVHISNLNQLNDVVSKVPEELELLAETFWPGPLTLVLPKSPLVPLEVTAGLPNVGVRMPAHRVALALIEEAEAPLSAPSANVSGSPSPTLAEHVLKDLDGKIEGVLDAGETLYGVESTILDLTVKPPVLLRPGALPVEKLEEVLGLKVQIPGFARGLNESEVALAPGMKYRHYAPKAEMTVVESSRYSDQADLIKLTEAVKKHALYTSSTSARTCILCTDETIVFYSDLPPNVAVKNLGSRRDPFTIARNLFKTLREIDEEGFLYVVAEGVEEKGLGLTIMNRLRKASGYRIIKI
ncbi:MAG: L-threonylcarbamoyladenylate synthase [Thermofilaceae archaeon]|nr:L-threonylcarbamoyladenylate synthase [Thermofilaceae archaeon]MCX8180344.1 L-threonylcarbamoyladenylate synthase [Thermofilaceae archaeon]MDW8003879.1 L-threonylcarbamoyladenylate synthase [Thermofilaceae archaeon]